MIKDDKNQDKREEKVLDEQVEETESCEIPQKEENKELLKCQKKAEELENQVKRVLADYQNLEKRAREERLEWIRSANKELISKLLPGLDMLLLAAKHVDDQGLKLSIKQFEDALKQEGLEKIDTEGKQFDPHTMECIETVEGKEGEVVEEIRPGYKMYDKILRPAQVKVGKGE